MSINNGKLITPLSDETERIEVVEKKVNRVVVSLRDLINYTNQESDRLQKAEKTLAKVSHLDNRLQAVESQQKKSLAKVLIWINFLVSVIIMGLFAQNLPQTYPELQHNLQTIIRSFKAIEDEQ